MLSYVGGVNWDIQQNNEIYQMIYFVALSLISNLKIIRQLQVWVYFGVDYHHHL